MIHVRTVCILTMNMGNIIIIILGIYMYVYVCQEIQFTNLEIPCIKGCCTTGFYMSSVHSTAELVLGTH